MAFALLYGSPLAAVLVPVAAGASLFSSLLGNDAYAKGSEAASIGNSQTISILSAEVVPADKKTKSETTGSLRSAMVESAAVSENALFAQVTPNSISAVGGSGLEFSEGGADDISVYVVRKGDSIGAIAEMFNVSVNTILWANDLKKGAPLREGDTLFILPVSGVQHTVAKGETLATISKKYKVDVDVIESFNGLDRGAVLAVGDELVIPDAEMPNDAPKDNGKKPTSGGSQGGKGGKWVDASGYFKHPLPGMKRRSQGLHGPGKRGIDMAAPTGTPIYAAADGIVILSKDGWNGAYGNLEIIQHPNGTKTLYAHMSKRAATTGQNVKQGDLIGYVGSTGRSTGPHLHFEVHNAKNPF